MRVHTVIGGRDMEANAASVRIHGKGKFGANPRGDVIVELLLSINEGRR